MRSTKQPPQCRAKIQLNSAVRALPTWSSPVGEGRSVPATSLALMRQLHRRDGKRGRPFSGADEPHPSLVLAFTLIREASMPQVAAICRIISGMYAASFGLSRTTVASILPIRYPFAPIRRHTCASRSRLATPR